MAELKIYQPQIGPKAYSDISSAGLMIPLNVATQQGAGISKLGKAITDIYKDQKLQDDKNRYHKLLPDIQKKLSLHKITASKGSNLDAGLKLYDQLIKGSKFDDLTKNESKYVKKNIKDYIRAERVKSIGPITSSIIKNHLEDTDVSNKDYLKNLAIKQASPNLADSYAADQEFKAWTSDESNKGIYGSKGWKKLLVDHDNFINDLRVRFRVKTEPFKVIKDTDKLLAQFGPDKLREIQKQARTQLKSNVAKESIQERLRVNSKADQQVENFVTLLTNINNANKFNNNAEFVNAAPNIDAMYDAKSVGSITNAQYDVLLQAATGKEFFQDYEMIGIISAQLAIAKDASEIDELNRAVFTNPVLLAKVGPEDVDAFNKMFKSFKPNRRGHQEYKKYQGYLEDTLGKIKFILGSRFSDTERQQTLRANRYISEFNQRVADQERPEDVYFDILSRVNMNELPSLDTLAKPVGADLTDFAQTIRDNPINTFKDINKQLAEKVKADNKYTMDMFKKDVARMDLIKDLYEARLAVAETNPKEGTDPQDFALKGKFFKVDK